VKKPQFNDVTVSVVIQDIITGRKAYHTSTVTARELREARHPNVLLSEEISSHSYGVAKAFIEDAAPK
jgi:hypothetical protein